jgi:hypothetical protein
MNRHGVCQEASGEFLAHPLVPNELEERTDLWPQGYRAGISLSYDGGGFAHREVALSLLDYLGLRGTFFVDGSEWVQNLPLWQQAIENDHEIGNGCLVRQALPDGKLPRWTMEMIMSEILETNEMFRETISYEPPSFAFPWGYPTCANEGDYRKIPQTRFLYCRSGLEGYNQPDALSPKYLRCIQCDGLSGAEMIALGEAAAGRGGYAIFSFAGIGEGNPSVDAEAHEELLIWLAAQKDIFTAPIQSICEMLAPLS